MPVTDKDNGFAATLALLAQTPPKLETGVFGAKADQPHGDSKATVGDICNYMEHGTPTIPERPFLSGWWDRHEEEAKARLAFAIRELGFGNMKSWDEVFRVFGNFCVAGIRAEMPTTDPPLALSTIRRKGSWETLIESGLPRDSVDFRLVP